jgi:hypothetical protein
MRLAEEEEAPEEVSGEEEEAVPGEEVHPEVHPEEHPEVHPEVHPDPEFPQQ